MPPGWLLFSPASLKYSASPLSCCSSAVASSQSIKKNAIIAVTKSA